MRLQLTVTHRPPSPTGRAQWSAVDVEVDAPAGSTVGELVDALTLHLGPGAGHPPGPEVALDRLELVVAGHHLDPHALVGEPPLLNGAAITLHAPNRLQRNASPRAAPRRSVVVLTVSHGPDCGRSIDLHPGRHTLGRSEGADICIDDSRLSRLHAEVVVSAEGVTVRDLGSTNGTRVDGTLIGSDGVVLTTGAQVHVGDTVVALVGPGAVPASTSVGGDGTLAVNRRPRIQHPHGSVTVSFPATPTAPRRTRVPWVAVLLPVPIAAVLALVVGPTMLAFALMGPVLMVGTALSDRWGSRKAYAADVASHAASVGAAQAAVQAACREEEGLLVRRHPDPAALLSIATGPTERLWERSRDDDDAFHVSPGLCRRHASVRVTGPDPATLSRQAQLEHVPCVVPLGEVGVLGICGGSTSLRASASLLVAQLVTLHSPADLEVTALLSDEEAAVRWSWLSRAPHCRNESGAGRTSRFAVLECEDRAVRTIIETLATSVRERLATRHSRSWDGPTTLLLVDGIAAFRGVPGLATLLSDGPRVGVLCLALERERSRLPHEARAVLDLPLDGPAALDLPGQVHDHLVVDGVRPAWSERLGRSLAALRDASPTDGPAALPAAVGLLKAGTSTEGSALATAWQDRPHSTIVPLGVCATGAFSIDLAVDGPHLLVGGTTGSGKSELLRTLVASLALRNAPSHLSFVLVDYKGGAAFRECAALPHVAGIVTDLDDQLAARALVSLGAEVRRRELLLRDAGCADFLSYQRSSLGSRRPLARLVVVVDEFRALADELPAFVDGLVRVVSLGRSLGIHLVLATQRPAGVVTADIKANVNLRIALRVRDAADSLDVIDGTGAAAIDPSVPGRAHARTGGSAVVEFQAAHVGSPFHGSRTQELRVRSWSPSSPSAWPLETQGIDATELDVVVDLVRQASAVGHHAPAPAAWLPPLPERLPHSALEEESEPLTAHVGLVDVPAEQRQHPLAVTVGTRGHWAVVGNSGSGRTTFLVTVARTLCARNSPAGLHLYAVSSGSLASLDSLPHMGARVDWSDLSRVERLLERLSIEVARRRVARESGPGQTPAASDPSLLLLLDDWDLVASRGDDLALAAVVDRVLALLREGEAVGLVAVLAGDRSLLLGRAAATVSHRVVLRLTDPTDAVLLGLPPRQVAALRRPGHGLTADGHEVQLALPPDPSAAVPTASLADRAAGTLPLRVDPLPATVREEELHQGLARQEECVALGLGGDEQRVLELSPGRDGRRWLVAGAAGSGVSSALLLVARSLLASGRPVAVVAPRSGPLDLLRDEPGVTVWSDADQASDLVAARRKEPSLAIVVDAADELVDQPIEPVLREIASLVDRDGGLFVVGVGATALSSMYRGLAIEVARHRTGILLGPRSVVDVHAFGVKVPVDRDAGPGRGHVVRHGVATPIQVALPAPAPALRPAVVAAPPLAAPGARG